MIIPMEEKKNNNGQNFAMVLLRKLWANEISHDQFEKEMLYWQLVEIFDGIVFVDLPSPPVEMMEYLGFEPETRARVDKSFWNVPRVARYIEARNEVMRKNLSAIESLRDLVKKIPPDDVDNLIKVQKKLADFEKKYEDVIEKLKRER